MMKAEKTDKEKFPPARTWEVTLFNEDKDDEDFSRASELMQETFDAGVFQIEKAPDTGRLHLQGMGQYANPRHWSTVVKALSNINGLAAPHVERCRNVRALVEYCQKSDTRVQEPVTWGQIRYYDSQGSRTDLKKLREMVDRGMTADEILLADTDGLAARYTAYVDRLVQARQRQKFRDKGSQPVRAFWLYGDSGVGKTSLIYDLYSPDAVYRIQSYRHPWDEVDESHHRVLALDDFQDGYLDFGVMLGITDRWPMILDARYQQKRRCWDTVWVISNDPPVEFYQQESRSRRAGLFRRLSWVMKLTQAGQLIAFEPTDVADYMGDPANAPADRFPSRQVHEVDSAWTRRLALPPKPPVKMKPITADDLFT